MRRISWIGVGIMGKAMVRNLMKAGYEVHIYARHPEKVADVVSEGAVPHGSIAECVKASEVVITMVGFPKDVEEVYFAPGNILDSAVEGMTLIEDAHFIERGYEDIVGKLTALGAHIRRIETYETPSVSEDAG